MQSNFEHIRIMREEHLANTGKCIGELLVAAHNEMSKTVGHEAATRLLCAFFSGNFSDK